MHACLSFAFHPRHWRGCRHLGNQGYRQIAAVLTVILLVSLFSHAVPAAGLDAPPPVVTVRLLPASGSAVKGRAVLRAYDALTTVEVLLVRGEAQYVVELRQGDCQALSGKSLLPLSDAVPGTPVTTLIDIPLQELLVKGAMIVVLRPAPDLQHLTDPANVVACGQISLARSSAKPPRTGTAAILPRTTAPLALIGAVGLASLAAGLLLRSREH